MNQSWCDAVRGQRDSLSPALRARVDSAIATIRGRGNNCVALADEAQAEWNRGDLRFGLPIKDDTIVGNPNQPTGGASKGDASQGESYTVIDMKFLAKNYDKARKTQIISGGVVLGNGDLSVLIAHEMDHRINKAPHIENNPLKTPLAFSCSDLHS
jgi:hypothetical protein